MLTLINTNRMMPPIAPIGLDYLAGAANNQLLEPHHADALKARGVLYAPDYVVSAGGIINIYNPPNREALGVEQVTEDTEVDGTKVGEQCELVILRGQASSGDCNARLLNLPPGFCSLPS